MSENESACFVEEQLLPVLRRACHEVADAWLEAEDRGNFVYVQLLDETLIRVQVSGGVDCMIYEVACALKEANIT